jgi:hypothetical protein
MTTTLSRAGQAAVQIFELTSSRGICGWEMWAFIRQTYEPNGRWAGIIDIMGNGAASPIKNKA